MYKHQIAIYCGPTVVDRVADRLMTISRDQSGLNDERLSFGSGISNVYDGTEHVYLTICTSTFGDLSVALLAIKLLKCFGFLHGWQPKDVRLLRTYPV